MTPGSFPICAACRHLGERTVDRITKDGWFAGETPTCLAFPDGIPDEIWLGGYDHRRAFFGDLGVHFELGPGGEEDLAAFDAATRRPGAR